MLVKIGNGGRVDLYDDKGCFLRTIMRSGAIDADVRSDGMIVFTNQDGRVGLYDVRGCYLRTIVNHGAHSARWSGNDVAVRLSDGRIGLYDDTGCYKRTI